MEAGQVGPSGPGRAREADIAPAAADPAAGRVVGWSPADPGPLGLSMFAITTFVLSVINAHLVSQSMLPTVFGLALLGGGLVQLIAGIWEFRTGNTFGAVAFCSYAAFWGGLYILLHSSVPLILKAEASAAIGLYLWAWTIFTVIMFIAVLRTSGALVVTFLVLLITFVLLSIGFSGASTSTIKLGGYFGIATAILAWYTAGAAVINSTWGRVVLPVFPLNA
jgi:succinate-acetate transporter protein